MTIVRGKKWLPVLRREPLVLAWVEHQGSLEETMRDLNLDEACE